MEIIRQVKPSDLATICNQRRRMFTEAGFAATTLDLMQDSFPAWLTPRLASGDYFGFLAELDSSVIGGIGLFLIDWPPHPLHPTTEKRGYILNVFVEPSARGTGLAKRLMIAAENEFKRRGVTYGVLHASAMGRPVYEKLAWESTTEMGKVL